MDAQPQSDQDPRRAPLEIGPPGPNAPREVVAAYRRYLAAHQAYVKAKLKAAPDNATLREALK